MLLRLPMLQVAKVCFQDPRKLPNRQSQPPPLRLNSGSQRFYFRLLGRIVAQEFYDPRYVVDFRPAPVQFPVGDCIDRAYNLGGDILLVEAQIEPAGPDMVPEGIQSGRI
jgi:hypothetical protein